MFVSLCARTMNVGERSLAHGLNGRNLLKIIHARKGERSRTMLLYQRCSNLQGSARCVLLLQRKILELSAFFLKPTRRHVQIYSLVKLNHRKTQFRHFARNFKKRSYPRPKRGKRLNYTKFICQKTPSH